MKNEKSLINLNNKGITLVVLVVTLILLLILSGITISQLTGSGLFENAKLAEQKSKEAQEKEEGILADYENKVGQYVDGSRDTVTLTTEQYNDIMNRLSAVEQNKIGFIDFNNLLTTITTQGASWTATEDCAVVARLESNGDGYTAILSVDNVGVLETWIAEHNNTYIKGIVYAKKGSVITTRADHGTYDIKVYGLQ